MRNEKSVLRTVTAALGALVFGGLLLVASRHLEEAWYTGLFNDLGSLVIASIALFLVFDFWQKEAFFNELFGEAKSVEQLKTSGITGFSASFHEQIDWESLFAKSTELDILFTYGSTWRNSHSEQLERMIARRNSKLRVILPDPAHDITMNELYRRFSIPVDQLRQKISDAHSFFDRLASKYQNTVELYYTTRPITYSLYRFNNEVVLALYTHRIGRSAVPTFIATRGGALYDTIDSEWNSLMKDGLAQGYTRKVI